MSARGGARQLPGGDDTIAAIATPRGRGALAMVRMSGPDALEIGALVLRPWHEPAREAWLAAVHEPERGELVDRGIAVSYRAPASYTGEDLVEITVHGGQMAPVLTLAALLRAGAREALPGEFTRRAVLNGRMDLLQAEAVGELINAGSRAMHRAALRQLEGSLSRRLGDLRDAILELEALIAYDIDFPEEDEGQVPRERVDAGAARVLSALDALLDTAHTGEVIREGAVVVIAGPPNVGKSSLFNALVGSAQAIVTEIPGTTRDALEALVEIEGWPVRLVDTAGLRESADLVERLGIEVSERWLARADLVLACAETSVALAETVRRTRALTTAAVLPVRTKSDIGVEVAGNAADKNVAPHTYRPQSGEAHAGDETAPPSDARHNVSVSAITGAGLGDVASAIASFLASANVDPAGELPLLLRERHRHAVESARSEVAQFRQLERDDSVPAVIGAVHLRSAAAELTDLIGAVDVEDVLDRVFASFCVGK